MKTTVAEYKQTVRTLNVLNSKLLDFKMVQDMNNIEKTEIQLDILNQEYFNLLPYVNVSFYIGAKQFFRKVVKLGSKYFLNGEVLSKSNGYYDVVEIPTISKEMIEDMLYE